MREYNAIAKKDGKDRPVKIRAQNIARAKAILKNRYSKIVELVPATESHFCSYCGRIVYNNVEDLLCDECRKLFGHVFYSEL